jgi:hypothetical protein
VPAVAAIMVDALPPESYDPGFNGQELATTYFDDADFDLRKARLKNDKYLTLRLRRYKAGDQEAYALSAKTEDTKWRVEVDAESAQFLLGTPSYLVNYLPGDLAARYLELVGERPLLAVATVLARRYAVEDAQDRLTLDVDVATDAGKHLPFGVLEFKSSRKDAPLPDRFLSLRLRPLKLSKFLWSTGG